MDTRILELSRGRSVAIAETGNGTPLLYLHGFADVHSASVGWLPFHEQLAASRRLIAPAHPGCADSDEDEDIDTIDDVVFHYLEVMDSLALDRVDIVGYCFGGWIAAELAARNPERVGRLALIGACGLLVDDQPIGDLFMEVQAQNGVEYRGLRELMFAAPASAQAMAMFPDGRSDFDREMSRFKAMRFASRVGFRPPYFYHRLLRQRLSRTRGPALVVWGSEDRMVPVAHARAYGAAIRDAQVRILPASGHCVHVERATEVASAIAAFVG